MSRQRRDSKEAAFNKTKSQIRRDPGAYFHVLVNAFLQTHRQKRYIYSQAVMTDYDTRCSKNRLEYELSSFPLMLCRKLSSKFGSKSDHQHPGKMLVLREQTADVLQSSQSLYIPGAHIHDCFCLRAHWPPPKRLLCSCVISTTFCARSRSAR